MTLTNAIDRDRLQEYSGGDREFEQELLDLFIVDTQQRLTTICDVIAAAQAGDKDAANVWSDIYQEAHHLKGSSGNIGAYGFQALATQLEQQAKNALPCDACLTELQHTFAELTKQVEQWSAKSQE